MMCGRFAQIDGGRALVEHVSAYAAPAAAPRYNVAPGQTVPVLRQLSDTAAGLAPLRWGLIPSWSRDATIGNRLINARSETVAEKPSFRAAFRARRCLIPADGFYEWQRLDGRKQPYFIRLAAATPFAMAGLWESWRGAAGVVETFTILTTAANDTVRPIHERMPVILDPAAHDAWLDPDNGDPKKRRGLLMPYAGAMIALPVGNHVNRVGNDDRRCIEPLSTPPPEQLRLF